MAKRFTDTNKWDDPWFTDLDAKYKLAWEFITSKCDAVGVWKPSKRLLEFNVGKIDITEFLKVCENRIHVMEGGNWWIVKFCDFQYGELIEENCYGEKDGKRYVKNKPHLSYINLLKKHRLWIDYTKGIHTLKEKDKEKETDKEEEKETEQDPEYENVTVLTATDFEIFWEVYDKKVGDKKKLKKKWDGFKEHEREAALAYIPGYVKATPDKKYRKDPSTFLNNKSWTDEIITRKPTTSGFQKPDANQLFTEAIGYFEKSQGGNNATGSGG